MVKKNAELKIAAPKLPDTLPLLQKTEFQDEACVKLCRIEDCELEAQTSTNMEINQICFKNVIFHCVRWPRLRLTDTVFEQCDLSNVDFSQSCMDRVRFIDCKLMGINLSETSLRNVILDHCNAAYSVWRYFKCKKCGFREISFVEADFYAASLESIGFERCNLDRAQFSGTKLAGVDLSTCRFYQLAVMPEDLRGCIIAPEQAIALSNIFGVAIKA